jgi:hypothetical protein
MKSRNLVALIIVVFLCVTLAGCATGGGGSSRGSLSQATKSSADSGDKDESEGRGQGRTRTKDDHRDQTYGENSYQDEYYEEEDSGGGFLFGLIASLFSGNDDEEEYDPYDYQTFSDDGYAGDDGYWTDADEFGMAAAESGNEEETRDGSPRFEGRRSLLFWFSPSVTGGDVTNGFTDYSLFYSRFKWERTRVQIGIYYGRGQKGGQQEVREGIRWISEAGLDLGLRSYLTSSRSQLGFYLIFGLRLGAVSWSYVNAIEAPNGDGTTETISNDGLFVTTPYAGLGTSFLQSEKLDLGLNFTVGGRLYADESHEDFNNDLFKNVMEYRLNFEVGFFF